MLPPSGLMYPESVSARDAWIVAQRPPRVGLDPWRACGAMVEDELGEPTATVFLTNRECPWKCLMCDLWRHTLVESAPPGAIPEQVREALAGLPPATQVKLYNAGSFFDPRAVPESDHAAIAALLQPYRRVVVECHPALVGERMLPFQRMLPGRLEVALGLETVHPAVLPRLNKRMTVSDFEAAASFLARHGMDLRVFLLVRPPFMTEEEGVAWAGRSLDVAFRSGARVVSLIPTRDGNGALDLLRVAGHFSRPSLRSVERAVEYGLSQSRGAVLADTWDLERFYTCTCSPQRAARLHEMNRTQAVPPPVECSDCGA